ncbi:MAG: DEAD/DEAH box helicase, partial [Phascolarctobacterium sp.]|nr:DEAD/DEAH box helicase [Candidatus Phascolarctobacterium equi]
MPYELTAAQKKAWYEISADLEMTRPMHRILQGDVGSGKTAIAALALAKTAASGYQGAIMAPTEILARQHFDTLQSYLQPAGIKVGLIVGGMKEASRNDLLKDLKAGKIDVLVGTHALLQEDVAFNNLALVITDEQHRFGVEQRAKLTDKANVGVHTLVMTATPIPRTLALTVYGDLDISRMEGKPVGRKPVRTLLYTEEQRLAVYKG